MSSPSAIGSRLKAAAFLGLFAGTLFAQGDGPSLEKLEKYRRDAMLAGGFAPLLLGSEADRQVSLVAGKGQPLLFLHGVGNHGSVWFEVAPAFVGSYRVVVPDLPGHGESAPASGDLPMATIVAGAERLLLEVTKERPAIVVGNSMGAWIATLLALRHPDKVERIVLVNGGPLPGDPGAPSLLPQDRDAAARLMAMLRDPSAPPLPDWLLDDLVRRAPTGPTARLTRDLPGLIAHLLVGRLGEVRTPVDLLWGASDQLMKVAYAERLQEQFPAARLTLLDHCGHIPQLECAPTFVWRLQALLAAAPPAAAAAAPAKPTAAPTPAAPDSPRLPPSPRTPR
ncbi:MAG: alpha/beta hydrolase [Thermoanaerobaculia bacterium]